MTGSILIVDSESGLRDVLRRAFELEGFRISDAADEAEGSKLLLRGGIDAVLVEVFLRGPSGVELLRWMRKNVPEVEIVLMGLGLPGTAASDYLREGAFAFLPKPLDIPLAVATLAKAIAMRRLRLERQSLQELLKLRLPRPHSLLAELNEPWMEPLRLAAPTELPLLIYGEPGLEKSALAAAIHDHSHRSDQLFLTVPVSTLRHQLGPKRNLSAILEPLNDGSIVIEGIAGLDEDAQSELAEIIERRRLNLPDGRSVALRARIIATHDGPWEQALQLGRIDRNLARLFDRLRVLVPPLRERPARLERALDELFATEDQRDSRLSRDARSALVNYPWPGNLVELRSIARLLAQHSIITPAELPAAMQPARSSAEDPSLTLAEIEKRHIAAVLAREQGNKIRSARVLDINVKTLYNKIRLYELER